MGPMLASPDPEVAAYFTLLMVWWITGAAPTDGVDCSSTCHAANANALTIRRVQDHHSTSVDWRHALQRVATAEFDDIRHTGALGIALCKVDHAKRHIAAVDQRFLPWFGFDDALSGLGFHGGPGLRLKRHKLLKGKTAQ
jgi:hypothetical protein